MGNRVITFRKQLTGLGVAITPFTLDQAYINGVWSERLSPFMGWILGHRIIKTSGAGTEVTEFNVIQNATTILSYTNTPDPELFDFVKGPIGRGIWFEISAPPDLNFQLSVDTGSDTAVDVEIDIEIP